MRPATEYAYPATDGATFFAVRVDIVYQRRYTIAIQSENEERRKTMQTETNRELLSRIDTSAIVTTPQGSWRWQKAFRVASYEAAERIGDGVVVWRSVEQGRKRSINQLPAGLPAGSLHNCPVRRADAVAAVGESRVRRLEGSGFRFAA